MSGRKKRIFYRFLRFLNSLNLDQCQVCISNRQEARASQSEPLFWKNSHFFSIGLQNWKWQCFHSFLCQVLNRNTRLETNESSLKELQNGLGFDLILLKFNMINCVLKVQLFLLICVVRPSHPSTTILRPSLISWKMSYTHIRRGYLLS